MNTRGFRIHLLCYRDNNYCQRSVVFDIDHLCEECHEQAAGISKGPPSSDPRDES